MRLRRPVSDYAEFVQLLEETEAQMVDLKFTDLAGRWRHVTLPAETVSESLFIEGVGFDGSSVSAFQRVESGDLCLIPDPRTTFIDPFYELTTISALCTIVDAETREQFPADPRYIASKAENRLGQLRLGLAGVLMSPELEFHLLDDVSYADEMNHSFFHLQSREAPWNSGIAGNGSKGNTLNVKGGYHATRPRDHHGDLRNEMVLMIQRLGIPVKYHHHEVGAPGQMEIEVLFDSLVNSADAVMMMKYVVRNLAARHGLTATFMPKPIFGEAGNGMHVHQMLRGEDDSPIFFDESDPYAQLSAIGYGYIAGILDHGRSICAFTNPSTNSYKRLVPGYEAPTNLYYSLGNRCAAIRLPKYATSPMKKRIEFRTPDACGNIYLSLAAQLMAGIDGIIRNLDPRTIPGMGPFDEDMNNAPESERPPIVSVPASLEEALVSLENDHGYLTSGNVFPVEFIDTWIRGKRRYESLPVAQRPTPYEYRLYFDL